MKLQILLVAVLLVGCVAQVTPQATPNATDTAQPTATEAPALTPIPSDTPEPTVSPTWTATPTQTPRPTAMPTVPPTPAPSPTARPLPTAIPTQPSAAGITLVSLTSPAARGDNATLAVRVSAGAKCIPGVIYKSGASKAPGLDAKTAGQDGNLSWTWKVSSKTTPGTWKVYVNCTPGGHAEWPFVVQ